MQIPESVQKSKEIFEYYYDAARTWQIQAKEDEDFANGAQWSREDAEALKKRNMAPIVVNVISPTVDHAVAMLTSNKPRFASTAREDSDTKLGKLFSDLMSYVWEKSEGNTELKIAIYDYYVKGLGYLMAYYDKNGDFGQGSIEIKAVNPYEVYVDPNSKDRFFRDAANIIIATIKSKEQLYALYPDYTEAIDRAQPVSTTHTPLSSRAASEGQTHYDGYLDRYHDHYEVLDRYTKVKIPMYRVNVPSLSFIRVFDEEEFENFKEIQTYAIDRGGQTNYALTEQEIAQTKQMIEKYGTVFHYVQNPVDGTPQPVSGPEDEDPSAIKGSTTVIQPLTFGDLIQLGVMTVDEYLENRIQRTLSVGDELLYQEILPITEYPIVPLINRFHRNPFPDSDVRLVRPLQEFINKLRSLIIAHATNSTSVKLLLPRGSVNKKNLEEEWGKAGTAIIEFEPELGNPVVAGPVPLPNELYELEKATRAEVEFIFGIWQLQHGNPDAAQNTYKGTIAIDEFGQRRIKSKRDDIESAINRLAAVVTEMIQRYFTKERVLRLIQPDSTIRELRINVPVYDDFTNEIIGKLNDVTVGKYDVIMVSGSTLPSNRWARFEYYVQLYQLGIIDDIEVLKQTEVADTEAVLERKSIYQQLQSALAQAQQQIKMLEGDLQTAQREAVHANKKAELEKFKARLSEMKSSLQTATNITLKKLDLLVQEQGKRLREGEKE